MSSSEVSCSPVVLSGLFTVSSLVPAKACVRGEITLAKRSRPSAAAPASARPEAAPRIKRRRLRYCSLGVMRDEGMSPGLRMSMKFDLSRGKTPSHPLDTSGRGDVTGMRGGSWMRSKIRGLKFPDRDDTSWTLPVEAVIFQKAFTGDHQQVATRDRLPRTSSHNRIPV